MRTLAQNSPSQPLDLGQIGRGCVGLHILKILSARPFGYMACSKDNEFIMGLVCWRPWRHVPTVKTIAASNISGRWVTCVLGHCPGPWPCLFASMLAYLASVLPRKLSMVAREVEASPVVSSWGVLVALE